MRRDSGSEYVKMDFKSVVYNAARDGKLKRLKVSTLDALTRATARNGRELTFRDLSKFSRIGTKVSRDGRAPR